MLILLNQVITKSTLTLLHSGTHIRLALEWLSVTGGVNLLVLYLPVLLSQSVADLEALACRKVVEFSAELGL